MASTQEDASEIETPTDLTWQPKRHGRIWEDREELDRLSALIYQARSGSARSSASSKLDADRSAPLKGRLQRSQSVLNLLEGKEEDSKATLHPQPAPRHHVRTMIDRFSPFPSQLDLAQQYKEVLDKHPNMTSKSPATIDAATSKQERMKSSSMVSMPRISGKASSRVKSTIQRLFGRSQKAQEPQFVMLDPTPGRTIDRNDTPSSVVSTQNDMPEPSENRNTFTNPEYTKRINAMQRRVTIENAPTCRVPPTPSTTTLGDNLSGQGLVDALYDELQYETDSYTRQRKLTAAENLVATLEDADAARIARRQADTAAYDAVTHLTSVQSALKRLESQARDLLRSNAQSAPPEYSDLTRWQSTRTCRTTQ